MDPARSKLFLTLVVLTAASAIGTGALVWVGAKERRGGAGWAEGGAGLGMRPGESLSNYVDRRLATDATDRGSSARVLQLPAGSFEISAPVVIRNMPGLTLRGEGSARTRIIARGSSFAGKPILQFINCSALRVEGIQIIGDHDHPASAAIESHVDNPEYNFALWPTNQVYRDLVLGDRELSAAGKRPPPAMGHGIAFTSAATSDGNNDQSTIENVSIYCYRDAAISIEHGNSLLHRIHGGVFAYGRYGVKVAGGSFQMMGTNLFVDECDFVFEAPRARQLANPRTGTRDTSRYYHGSTITNVASEGNSDLMRTAEWPPAGQPMVNGMTGIHVYIVGYQKSGVRANPGLKPLGRAIDFRSAGHLSIVSSHLNFGRPTTFHLTNPDAGISLVGTYISNLYEVHVQGRFSSTSGFYARGPAKLVPGPKAEVTRTGDGTDWR